MDFLHKLDFLMEKYGLNKNSMSQNSGIPYTTIDGWYKKKSVKRIKKKIAAAVYEYQADSDGEWGEIQFDFVSGTAEIVRLAEWDTMVSKMFAEQAIKYIRACDIEHPPQKLLFAF